MPSFNPYGNKSWAMRNNAKPKRSLRAIVSLVKAIPDAAIRKAVIRQYCAELVRSNHDFDRKAFIKRCNS